MGPPVISDFKKLYTKALFQLCFEVTERTNLTLREFWKNHFDMANCLKIVSKAWAAVTQRTLNSAWRKLWPDCVLGRSLEGPAHEQEPAVVREIVSLGKALGLEVNEDDVQELVEEHGRDLTTDELMDLHREQQQEVAVESSPAQAEKKKAEEALASHEIREMCKMWERVQKFIEKHHPNKAVAVRAMNLFNDNAMSHCHELLKRRQNQGSLGSPIPSPNCSAPKRRRKYLTIYEKVKLLDLLQERKSYAAVARHYGMNESTIRYIKKEEANIRRTIAVNHNRNAKRTATARNKNIVRMESALALWIADCRKKNVPLVTNAIREKAKQLYEQFAGESCAQGDDKDEPQPGSSAAPEEPITFHASKGWFDRFRKRFQLKSVPRPKEAAPADEKQMRSMPRRSR
ncbi:hypothetical protein JRQ81_012158 [Phrynocephalus forsythii]|uniref:HTH CENPB-type domain-containing protein n=1 Tax=Phrynocephalus forsythii TaxID=171643 RepID=A0A9Q1AQ94_9SAUR|nr:hypothetical protein JRQ81_012158 [Phrynocephalus forsythii]